MNFVGVTANFQEKKGRIFNSCLIIETLHNIV